MSDAGPFDPDRGKQLVRGGSGSSSRATTRRPAGGGDLWSGPSDPDREQRKRRRVSPLGTSNSGGVEEGIESQGAKRHRTVGGGTGGDNQMSPPFQTGHPGALLLQQGGDNGLLPDLPDSGKRVGPQDTVVPANSRSGQAPQQWVQHMPNMLAAVAGRGSTSANDVSVIGKAAHQVANLSPSGLIDFLISPTYEENRLPRLDQTRAQRREGIENAERLPFDWRGRSRGRGGGREPAAPQSQTRELSEEDNKKIAEAVLFVFSAEKDVDMSGPNCDSCMKTTHKTGHCPEPSSKCDTAVDSFCDSTFQRNHPLDSESRSRNNSDPIGCNILHEHFEAGRLVDLFIHLILYRIHKPPLRVHSEKFCWIRVLLKFADVYCGGQMPAAIVENGGLLPYTKNDVASYKSELQRFDEVGVKAMPRGECEGKTIEEIKTMRRRNWVRRQVYFTYSEKHPADKLHRLSAINMDDSPTDIDAASNQAAEEGVQLVGPPQGIQNLETSSSGPAEDLQMDWLPEVDQNLKMTEPVRELESTMDGTQEALLSATASVPLAADKEIGWTPEEDNTAPRHQAPLSLSSEVATKIKVRGVRSGKSVAVTNQSPPAPIGLHNFLMASNHAVPAAPPVSVSTVVLSPVVAQAWLQEMQRGQVQDQEMLQWTTQVQTCSTISCSWSEVAAKLSAFQASGHLSPEFEAIMKDFGATQQ